MESKIKYYPRTEGSGRSPARFTMNAAAPRPGKIHPIGHNASEVSHALD